jgi:hypothetical protein
MNVSSVSLFKNISSFVSHTISLLRSGGKEGQEKIQRNKIKLIDLIKDRLQKLECKDQNSDSGQLLTRILRYCDFNEYSLAKDKNVKKIESVIASINIFAGAPPIYEKNPKPVEGQDAKNILKYLFSDQDLSFKFIDKKIISALLYKKDEELLGSLREELNLYFTNLNKKLNSEEYKDPQSKTRGNSNWKCISIIPIF